MTPEKIQSIIETTIGQQFDNYWLYLLLSIFIALFSSYLIQYFKEKGKNLAIQEDIKNITLLVEDVKQDNKKEFEKIQNKNDVIVSEIKDTQNRYNSKQFELYNELWSSLIDLKISADELWDSATGKKLKDFSTKLYNAKVSIEKSSILIESNHYNELIKIIKKFEDFEFGKGNLIKLRQIKNKTLIDIDKNYTNITFDTIIEQNRESKLNYDILLGTLKKQFTTTIKGKLSNKTEEE